jgi:hypothetical protein
VWETSRNRLQLILPFCTAAVLAAQAPSPEAWTRADAATRRLPPSEFSDVSQAIRVELQRRGCTIPQVYTAGPPHNVVRGAFRRRGQSDVAVLCSRQHTSTILVFWGGDPHSVNEMASRADAEFLQVVGSGGIGFSRMIRPASPAFIREHEQRPRSALPEFSHDGIEDVFVEKASVVWYWREGKWLRLSGAD